MSWIWNNVADAFSQLLFIKNITYRCILESLFLFQLKTTKKNVPWDGEHLFQSLMSQYFSGHGGILIYEFIARKGKKNPTYIFFVWKCAEELRSYFHSFKHSENLCWHHVPDSQAPYFYPPWGLSPGARCCWSLWCIPLRLRLLS